MMSVVMSEGLDKDGKSVLTPTVDFHWKWCMVVFFWLILTVSALFIWTGN